MTVLGGLRLLWKLLVALSNIGAAPPRAVHKPTQASMSNAAMTLLKLSHRQARASQHAGSSEVRQIETGIGGKNAGFRVMPSSPGHATIRSECTELPLGDF
jgi:hypothetical protein